MITIQKLIVILFAGKDKEPNEQGNEIQRSFYPSERYIIDFAEDFSSDGWKQFDTDQDAHYFGAWVNPKKLQTLTYCEGDWSTVTCPDKDHYNAEIKSMIEFYGEGYEFVAIGKNSSTKYCQDRNKFFI